MAYSTGVTLLSTGLRSLTMTLTNTGSVIYSTGSAATGNTTLNITLVGFSGIANTVVEFSPTSGAPSYSLSNPVTSLTNTITFNYSSGSYSVYNGGYRVVVTTNEGTTHYLPSSLYYNMDACTFYFPVTCSYSTASLNIGTTRSVTYSPSVDAWGVSYHPVTNKSAGLKITGATSVTYTSHWVDNFNGTGNFSYFINPSLLTGSFSGDTIAFGLRDSNGIYGTFGGAISIPSTSRQCFMDVVDRNSSITSYYSANPNNINQQLIFTVNAFGACTWSHTATVLGSSTGMTNGTWCRENGGSPITRYGLGLEFKIQVTHVSGNSVHWGFYQENLSGSSSFSRAKDTTYTINQSGDNKYWRIKTVTINTTVVVRVIVTNLSDVLMFQEDITLTSTVII